MMRKHALDQKLFELSHKELTIEILKMATLGVFVAGMFVAPGMGSVYKLFDANTHNERRRVRRAFEKLEREKKLRQTKDGSYTSTVSGRQFLHEESFFEIEFKKPQNWNGKWFFVMFDIPNEQEYERKLLRNKLLEVGFIPYQHSVYVFPYECREFIKKLEKHLSVEGCIRTVIATEIDDQNSFSKSFKL